MTTATKLLAYPGGPKQRTKLIREMAKHVKLDMLRQGATGDDDKGCTVACALHSLTGKWDYDHAQLGRLIGVPEAIMRLCDSIFEGLPTAEAKEFSQAWPKAIRAEADLSLVWPKLAIWMLIDPTSGVIRFAGEFADVKAAIEKVAALWQRVVDGESAESLKAEFESAESAAWSAAWSAESAARSAESAARSAAWSAAWSAESAAWSAESARSAAWSAAESAARSAESAELAQWKAIAAKTLELLSDA